MSFVYQFDKLWQYSQAYLYSLFTSTKVEKAYHAPMGHFVSVSTSVVTARIIYEYE